ncbi:MAG: MoaD/ThiS family protein [Thermoanaerobacteraceae bacterium]|nr:MoaD/ThiS family protein [Thermoanaerobacteraceae bacterium]
MRVTVTFLGPAASFAGRTAAVLEVAAPATVKEILEVAANECGFRVDPAAWAVLLDGRGVPPEDWDACTLDQDCQLTVLPMLAGG